MTPNISFISAGFGVTPRLAGADPSAIMALVGFGLHSKQCLLLSNVTTFSVRLTYAECTRLVHHITVLIVVRVQVQI